MYILIAVLVILFTTLLGLYLKEANRFNKHLSHFPGPKGLPFLGQALELSNSEEMLKSLHKYVLKYGNLCRITIAKRQLLICSDPKFYEFILTSTKHIDKSSDYKTLVDWFGDGLLTASGNKWKVFRKIITPTFHFEILEPFVEVFNTSVDILIKKLENEINNEKTNIYPYVTLCALDSICETAMGTSVNAQEDPNSVYVRSVKEMSRILIDRSFSIWKQFDTLFKLSSDYRLSTKCIKILHNYSNSVIKSRKEALLNAPRSEEKSVTDEFGKKKKMAFLDLLLQSTIDGQPLSDLDIRQEVDTFMFEGHDTTASAMSFALYCLANNQDVQKKVMDELQTIYGDDMHRPCIHKDLQEMKYLELVIKETLRIFPSVPLSGRELKEDVEYDGGILPKGLTLTIFIRGIHMNPEVYPDPEKFDPDRFLPENQRKRNFYSYVPFSAGPRNCIGQKFAMSEMKTTISKILRFYELLPVVPKHNLRLAAETILKSHSGINLKIRKRFYNA